jgi:ketosteroid isomerase-like protein
VSFFGQILYREIIMRPLSARLAAFALFFATAACQPAAETVGPLSDEDVAAIRALHQEQVEAGLAGDWDAVGAFFAEDFVYMPPNMPVVHGRATWVEAAKAMGFDIIEMTTEILDIDGRGDLAYLRGAYSETFTVEGMPGPISDTGKFVWILRKQPDGAWLITTWIWNADQIPGQGQTS